MTQLYLFEHDAGRSSICRPFSQIMDGVKQGETFDAKHDQARLGRQALAVFELMSDGTWRTLREITDAIGFGSEAAISARLRDFRKPQFGSHVVNRRRRGLESVGCFEYQLEIK